MNLLLLEDSDFTDPQHVRLTGRRLAHMQDIQQVSAGDTLRVGRINGLMGRGSVLELDSRSALLHIELSEAPPAKLPLTLLLAMPRPKMFRRTLQHCATLGVPRIVLLNSYRVEKSFWQTPFLQPEVIRENLLLGLEQARDTILPEIELHPRFRPFVEDELPARLKRAPGLLAQPDAPERAGIPHATDPRDHARHDQGHDDHLERADEQITEEDKGRGGALPDGDDFGALRGQ